jgi:hypothetical protein
MHPPISYMECFRVNGRPSDVAIPVELRDDGLYTATYPQGPSFTLGLSPLNGGIVRHLGGGK